MMNPHELDMILTFIQQHPDAAARELELQTQDTAVELIQALPLHQSRQLIAHMLPPYAARLCAQLSLDMAAGLLSEFKANQAATILRSMPKPSRDELIKALPEKNARLYRLLLSYSNDSVGAWMSADIAMLPPNCRVLDALQRFSDTESSIIGDALPIVDHDGYLVGRVFIRDLLRAKGESLISHLRQDMSFTLSSRTSLATAACNEGWRHHDSLPVLNRNKQLVGLLRHADLRRSLEQFGEIAQKVPQDDLLASVGEVYIQSLIALLGLLDRTPQPSRMLGERS